MTSFSEVLLIGLENRTCQPLCAVTPQPLCPAALPSPILPLRGFPGPGLVPGVLNQPQISMSSSQLFILETPSAKAAMHAWI